MTMNVTVWLRIGISGEPLETWQQIYGILQKMILSTLQRSASVESAAWSWLILCYCIDQSFV
jgi:hypothetical protein